jgi:uncharacterized protein YbjT (DUF2867 family)
MKVILIGSTGLVGSEVLKILSIDQNITEVITPVRSIKSESIHPKQKQIEYNFDKNEYVSDFKNVDVIICTLGTTMKKALGQENFRKVDYDYPLNFAKLGKENGVKHFILNSAMGASSKSPLFYNRVKGEIENSIGLLNYEKFSIIRPGLIGGKREEFRLMELIGMKVLTFIGVILPNKLKINPAHKIAEAICKEVKRDFKGQAILTSENFI